ncbi:nucleoside permease NupC [Parabacteroides sp. PH5-13]|nr:nucleoside permease NupC [Parabacteroides sp. PH5-39]MDH6320311.1 nucleoside permease NupC [Parabacteroides sp. PH5-13]MDH6324041.1 nucleoside permease NupC [Parabacteroides sp. PH5-8]MDH6346225.1 nucleoside permease NupC [Parabacteroides sp. PH5-46]MDH6361174.1 nucleoside permease NupC [Parabacteroides sp. PH5-16]MDH6376854.1 nucleoside permease NupC [Parabacteroides sp. PH5-33]MDH6385126.1 nucleoside permease NupC [Parabacteroides sp. PH5-17]MDH6394509.1 nucleoside permease NupC [Paraba
MRFSYCCVPVGYSGLKNAWVLFENRMHAIAQTHVCNFANAYMLFFTSCKILSGILCWVEIFNSQLSQKCIFYLGYAPVAFVVYIETNKNGER